MGTNTNPGQRRIEPSETIEERLHGRSSVVVRGCLPGPDEQAKERETMFRLMKAYCREHFDAWDLLATVGMGFALAAVVLSIVAPLSQ